MAPETSKFLAFSIASLTLATRSSTAFFISSTQVCASLMICWTSVLMSSKCFLTLSRVSLNVLTAASPTPFHCSTRWVMTLVTSVPSCVTVPLTLPANARAESRVRLPAPTILSTSPRISAPIAPSSPQFRPASLACSAWICCTLALPSSCLAIASCTVFCRSSGLGPGTSSWCAVSASLLVVSSAMPRSSSEAVLISARISLAVSVACLATALAVEVTMLSSLAWVALVAATTSLMLASTAVRTSVAPWRA